MGDRCVPTFGGYNRYRSRVQKLTTMAHSRDLETASPIVALLVGNHRRFLSFLRPRVNSPADAEEILQAAFVKAVEQEDSVRDEESAVAWFFRLLRNALVDYYRRRQRDDRMQDSVDVEQLIGDWQPELERTICACLTDLIPTLKPEYADLLKQVDLEGVKLSTAATALGITSNNASVRLHRARTALKQRLEQSCGSCAEHGCLDCICKSRE